LIHTKRKKDGTFIVRSESAVQVAYEDIEALVEEIATLTGPLKAERDKLEAAVDAYLVTKEAGTSVETVTHKLTVVQGHTRKWNVDKLKTLVPRHVFKNITELVVVRDKLNEYVAAGEIDRDAIEEAFEEKPNAPYVKKTPKGHDKSGAAEADSLAERLA
jgi:hypothetical protein